MDYLINLIIPTVTFTVGYIVVITFSVVKYKNNIPNYNSFVYYLVLILFCIINIIFYTLVCLAILEKDIIHLFSNVGTTQYTNFDLITILLVSFAYTSVNSTNYKIPLKGIKINIYETIFENIQKLIPPLSPNKIIDHISTELRKQKDSVFDLNQPSIYDDISKLREKMSSEGWNLLDEHWESIKIEIVFDQFKYLHEIEKKISSVNNGELNIKELKEEMKEKKNHLLDEIDEKLVNYVKNVYLVNGKTAENRKIIYEILHLNDIQDSDNTNNYRISSVLTFFPVGIFLFAMLGLILQGSNIPMYAFAGSLTFVVLGFCTPSICMADNLIWCSFNGFLSGFLTNITWIFFLITLDTLGENTDIGLLQLKKPEDAIVGGTLIMCLSMLLYFYRKHKELIKEKIKEKTPNLSESHIILLLYIVYCLLGGGVFVAILPIFYPQFFFDSPDSLGYFIVAFLMGAGVSFTFASISRMINNNAEILESN